MRISSWEEAERQAILEAEKRFGAKIKKYWVNSIALEPSTHGGLWSIKLDLRVKKRWRKKLVRVVMRLSPKTGELVEFKIGD